jgi:hypothetical protein
MVGRFFHPIDVPRLGLFPHGSLPGTDWSYWQLLSWRAYRAAVRKGQAHRQLAWVLVLS